jgi:hypothetical protein
MPDQEFERVIRLSGPERYDYSLKRFADNEEVWSLRDLTGWVLADQAGKEAIPVWPHRRLAEAAASGAWSGATAASIPLAVWSERWLRGAARDGRLIAVFPTPLDQGVFVAPERFQVDLDHFLEQFEL